MKIFREFPSLPETKKEIINTKKLIDILTNPEIHTPNQIAKAELTIAYDGTLSWLHKVKDQIDQKLWEQLYQEFLALDEQRFKSNRVSDAEIQKLLRICEQLPQI